MEAAANSYLDQLHFSRPDALCLIWAQLRAKWNQ